ncbi:MAG: DUF763 domain-containing protein [Dehalococcoidia bacterium]|nr:DUF763 domain-containing protein [Dehalococcoidia bacterium]
MSPASRTGVANLPLHGGKAPRWLFERMTKLAREICIVIVEEFGPDEMLHKVSDPYWFQAFGCVLGFDWHSSGLTTTTCGALKEGIREIQGDLGLFMAGGKGATSRKTPEQIEDCGNLISADPASLVYASKMAAKVDSAALQDGYQLYHHVMLFTREGSWAVVQQGMNESTRYARRYHWLGEGVTDFVCEPHAAICAEQFGKDVLNLVAAESTPAREVITGIAAENKPEKTIGELKKLQLLTLPSRHQIIVQDIHPDRISKIITATYERSPGDFEELLGLPGVGPKTIRALSLLSELIYGAPPSFTDPARFSFAHGGKDGIPYPVDRRTYDQSIELLRKAVLRAKLDGSEKRQAVNRLDDWRSRS